MSQPDGRLAVRGLALSPAKPATGVAAAALTVLTTVLGLQLVRLFIPILVFYLGDTLGISIFVRAGIGAAVFLAGLLANPLQRLLGLRAALGLAVVGTALVRVVDQLSTSAPADFALGIAGTIFFLLYVPLGLGAARAARPSRVPGFARALLLGVAADSALHIAAGTYDLTWQSGVLPLLVVVVLAAATLAALALVLPAMPRKAAGVSWRRAWPLLAVGPWLMLQMTVFQNAARTVALTGWPVPAAGAVIAVGNILGLVAAAWLGDAWSRWAALGTGAGLVLLLVPATLPPAGVAAVIVVGQVLAALLLMRTLSTSDGEGGPRGRLGRSSVAYGLGFLLFTLLFFGYNAPNNLVLPFESTIVLPITALFFGLAAASGPVQASGQRLGWPGTMLTVAAVVLLLAPAGLALAWQPVEPVAPAGNEPLRVMQYNLHVGFNTAGRLDLEAIAAVIEAADADVVTLQEVSRGWVITGPVDMLSWLAHRLDMVAVSGPTALDGQFGNAILSRYPVVAVERGNLASEGQALKRGYLQVDVDVGDTTVRAISTHLYQHIRTAEDSAIRQTQVTELLAAWNNGPRTVIAGDFNAWPEHAEMVMMADAGLQDVAGLLAGGPAFSSPADEPYQRIDYIWLSPDLTPESFAMTETTASDHLPLLAVVRLPAE
ncbi:MAG: endonuclease/exonuclease/phosphatase family protein [Anaerolineae bacterium]|nr:endonuclease/exonuclease/phosphatase family protein [Anaerolineae bacterium]